MPLTSEAKLAEDLAILNFCSENQRRGDSLSNLLV